MDGQQPQDIEQFVDWILAQKGELKDTPEDVKVQLKKDLVESLEDQINAALLSSIPQKDLPEMDQLIQNQASQEEIVKFCETKIPDMKNLVAGVLARFKTDFLGA